MRGFFEFIREQGIVGLALGFILGGAVSKLVTSLVNDIVNPLLGIFLGMAGNLTSLVIKIGPVKIMLGSFIANLIDFLVIAFVVYFVFKVLGIEKLDKKKNK